MGKEYYQQRDLNEQQIQAQKEENQIDRDFQSAQWLEHFNLQNQYNEEYNSPAAQVSRFQAAGINPALAMGEGSATATTAANPSSPSGGHGLSPLNQVVRPTNFAEILDAASGLNRSLAEAFKYGSEGQQSIRMTQPLVDKAIADRTFTDLQSVFQDYQNFIQGSTLNTAVAKRNEEVLNIQKQAYMFLTQGDLNKSEALLAKSRNLLTNEQSRLTGYQADYSAMLAGRASEIIQSEIDQRRASANASNAAALESAANAQYRNLETDFKSQVLSSEVDARLKELRSDGKLSEKKYSEALVELQRIRKVAKLYDDSENHVILDAAVKHFKDVFGVSLFSLP